MALANKLGNLLKKATSSNPSLYQAIRCMSSSKLFVGGLSYSTDEGTLKDAFASYGQVVEAKIIIDRESGRSRGFGFVTYTSSDEASSAIMAMDGKDLNGRIIRVNTANERTGGFRGGGGGNGGGFGGGGYGSFGGGGFGGGGGGGFGGYGGNSGVNYGGGAGYAPPEGSGGNDTFSTNGSAPVSGDNFAGSGNYGVGGGGFGGDSFAGKPAVNYDAPAGPNGAGEFLNEVPGSNIGGGNTDKFMDDIFKDDEPDTCANKVPGSNIGGGSFGGDSFAGNPAVNYDAPADPNGADEFLNEVPGSNIGGGNTDKFMDDIFKDDEPDTYANKSN